MSTVSAQPISEVRTAVVREARLQFEWIYTPALASAVLLWLSHFPVAWGWLAWIALVPLLMLVRSSAPPRRIYLAAWLGGLAFFLPALQWMRVADYRMYATWAMLATYCSLYFPLAIFLLRKLDFLPLTVSVPLVWTGLELVRAHFLTGFAWYFLSHTQHDFLPLIQISDVTGAYGVTFLIAAVNGLIFDVFYQRSVQRVWRQLGLVVVLLAGTFAYGVARLGQENFQPGPNIALIQGNLDQRIRNLASEAAGEEAARTMVKHYAELCDEAAAQSPRPDLIIWPETSYPDEWVEDASGQPDAYSKGLAEAIAKRWKTEVLIGLNSQVRSEQRMRRYNSALLVLPNGTIGGRYDKMHRVPFGEYVPLRDWLPWMNRFAPYDFDYSIAIGEKSLRFPLGRYRYGVVICYEDTDSQLARQYVNREPAVDFLVNTSNDGWFNGTSEHEEHLAICRFRAIECRRAVARAVNMGVSAVIDGSGRVVALPGPTWGSSKKVAAVVAAEIPLDRRDSVYARWGDWLPWGCLLAVGLGVGGSLYKGKTRAA